MAKPEPTKSTNAALADQSERRTQNSPLWTIERARSGIDRGAKISERVASAIVDDIVADGLKPGDRLPNEAAMIERFQVCAANGTPGGGLIDCPAELTHAVGKAPLEASSAE